MKRRWKIRSMTKKHSSHQSFSCANTSSDSLPYSENPKPLQWSTNQHHQPLPDTSFLYLILSPLFSNIIFQGSLDYLPPSGSLIHSPFQFYLSPMYLLSNLTFTCSAPIIQWFSMSFKWDSDIWQLGGSLEITWGHFRSQIFATQHRNSPWPLLETYSLYVRLIYYYENTLLT